MDAASVVANFLQSLQSNQVPAHHLQAGIGETFTTLHDLLPPSTNIDPIDSADQTLTDNLLSHLPPILLLAQGADDFSAADPTSETVEAAIEALSLTQKKDILRHVLRSPQFSQGLSSLTIALRDGGLQSISDALKIRINHREFTQRHRTPFRGGEAVKVFLDGIKVIVENEMSSE